MAKEICVDCGKVFEGGAKAFYCMDCRKRRISEAAKLRKLNRLGTEAYSAKQKKRRGSHD